MLKSIMLWNEPNNLSHWDFTLDPEWATYAELVRAGTAAIKAERKGLDVVLGGIAPIDPAFMERMVRLHGLEGVVDAVAIHGFPFDWHVWQIHEWPERVAEVRAVTALPILATEVGTSSFGCEEIQALGLQKTIELLPPLVEAIYWYSLFDLPQSRDATTRHKQAEGSAYYRHFYFGLLTETGRPKLALRHFPPEIGICQWLFLHEYHLVDATVSWLERLGVRAIRTGISWADSHVPGAFEFFDYMMRALDPFEVMVTLCFTPPSRGVKPHHTSPPLDLGEFGYFCQQVVRRYG